MPLRILERDRHRLDRSGSLNRKGLSKVTRTAVRNGSGISIPTGKQSVDIARESHVLCLVSIFYLEGKIHAAHSPRWRISGDKNVQACRGAKRFDTGNLRWQSLDIHCSNGL